MSFGNIAMEDQTCLPQTAQSPAFCWCLQDLSWQFLNCPRCSSGFPGGSGVKNPPANVGDVGLISGLERSLGGGNGNRLQYSCLGNAMDRGGWWAAVHGISKSRTWQQAGRQVLTSLSSMFLLQFTGPNQKENSTELFKNKALLTCQHLVFFFL